MKHHLNQNDEHPESAGSESVNGTFDLAAIVKQYETSLLGYVTQLIGSSSEDVQDVVQNTFLRLHRQVRKRGETSIERLSSWLFRVAHNLAMDAGRRAKRRRRLQEKIFDDPVINPQVARAAAKPDELLRNREACELAMPELRKLPEEQKNVVLLKIVQGFTLREISEMTGMKIGTVNYRLTQGLRELAQRLKKLGAIPE